MMASQKQYHFVAESYLSGFLDDGAEHLFCFSKRSKEFRRQQPEKLMKRNRYYHQPWVPQGVDPDVLEKFFANDLEPNGLAALRKLSEMPELIYAEDIDYALFFLDVQRLRVPRQIERGKLLAKSAIESELVQSTEGKALLRAGQIQMTDSFKMFFLRTTVRVHTPYFARMTWEIIKAQTGRTFITSDSPVTFFNRGVLPPDEPGLALTGTMVYYPINRNYLLRMVHPEYQETGMTLSLIRVGPTLQNCFINISNDIVCDPEFVDETNRIMHTQSQNLVVGSSRKELEKAVRS